ncbi:helix-turn-helix domain-containing protein [uncultured Oscillibacter sp.]|uniref:helix-turn-helix domain-containing protein n=1 Tax=uncultured Oscillibacter sp. TaxID=876091 RepID=UPI0025F47A9B|nr:helix-turn-helix transcriptional regulator [uncultured Oscillibacter sp.]
MTFAERLTELMESHSMTNYRLSKTIGCSATTVANWLDGKEVTQSYLQKLSDVFEVSVDSLLGFEQKEKSPVDIDEELLNSELIRRLCRLTPEEMEKVDAFVQGILAAR